MPGKEIFMANVAALQPLLSTEKHQLLFRDEVTAWLPFPRWDASLAVPAPGRGSSRSGTRWDSALGLGSGQMCNVGRAMHPLPLLTSRQKQGQARSPTFLKYSQAKRVELAKGFSILPTPINPVHNLNRRKNTAIVLGNRDISESQKKPVCFLVGRIWRKSKLYDCKCMKMFFAFLLTYSESHGWDSAFLLVVKILIAYIEILQKKTEHKTSQYYFVQHPVANKYYTYSNINIISETLFGGAIMLLLNSNLLKLDRPLVPPRMEGAACQKLNFVSLQIPLPQSVLREE